MFGFIKKARKLYAFYGRIEKAIDEGKDVPAAVAKVGDHFIDMSGDVRDAWDEIEEFWEAAKDVFK